MQQTQESHAWLADIPGMSQYSLTDYTSLEHKAQLLGIPESHIAKTIYFRPRHERDTLYCTVVQADRDVDEKLLLTVLRRHVELPKGICWSYKPPMGQATGRLGPFPTHDDLSRLQLILYDEELLRDVPLDFAHPTIEGVGLRLTLDALCATLDKTFGGQVRQVYAAIATSAADAAYARACRMPAEDLRREGVLER